MVTYKLSKITDYVQKFVDEIATGEWHNIESSQEYLAWLAEGNTPLPADEVTE